jgi:FSR family fosmidomycin resistance protein-like MFS transporter
VATRLGEGRAGAVGVSVLTLLFGAHIINDGMSATLAALLPTLQVRFELSEALLATLVAVLSFSSSVTQPLLGAVADRLGLRAMAALGVMVSALLLSLLGLAPSVATLILLLLVGGLGSAAFHPAGSSLARAAGGRFKELAVATFSSTGTIGLALGPIIILWLARRDALGFAPLLMVPGLILGGLLLLVLPARAQGSARPRGRLFDLGLFLGPVGLLSVAGILRSLAYVAFSSGMPLWLTSRGAAPDAPIISGTLAVFSISAGAGALLAGLLATRGNRTGLMVTSMLLALPALLATQAMATGSVAFYLLVAAGGALANVALPILVVAGQDLAPEAMGTASGMMLGFTWGVAGLLYIGVGRLQELIGIGPAISVAFFSLIPAALLTLLVMRRARLR